MEHQNPTGPGQYGSDRDTFLRVWQRVMPQQRPDCPIQPLPALPEGEGEPQPQAQGEPPEQEGTVLARQPRLVQGDFPSWQDVPCLGEGAMDQAERLRQLLKREELLWRYWKGLERRCHGVHQRALATMGEDCRRRGKRLSAALFLLTGVRRQPSASGPAAPRSLLGGLREQFLTAQQLGCAYRAAAEDCRDRCLRELYLELADGAMDQAEGVRALLERL